MAKNSKMKKISLKNILKKTFKTKKNSKKLKSKKNKPLKKVVKKKAKVVVISHLGRPQGKKKSELSLAPIYKFLKEHLETNIYFFMGDINEETKSKFSYLKEGEIILLENIRFFKEESENDEKFAKKLASLGDIYINDAFSCSHRSHASIEGITKHIPSYFGLQIMEEINDLGNGQ